MQNKAVSVIYITVIANKWNVRYSVKLGRFLRKVCFPMTLKQQLHSHTQTHAQTHTHCKFSLFKRVKFVRVRPSDLETWSNDESRSSEREEKQNKKEKQNEKEKQQNDKLGKLMSVQCFLHACRWQCKVLIPCTPLQVCQAETCLSSRKK